MSALARRAALLLARAEPAPPRAGACPAPPPPRAGSALFASRRPSPAAGRCAGAGRRRRSGRPGHRRGLATAAAAAMADAPGQQRQLWPHHFPERERALALGELGPTEETNMCNAINAAMRAAMTEDEKAVVFGEDVGFGGVFRCTVNLLEEFKKERVFNTPLCEQGIVGFAIGMAAQGWTPIAEIQFADYIFPAFDQITNEAAKMRFRSGGMFDSGGLTIRTPYGAVGHGGLYHSQSPESYFTQTPGLKVVVPRDPFTAKGLLIAAIRDKNPVIFLEPKMLYRTSVCEVPVGDGALPLSQADVVQTGEHVTVLGWGAQMRVLKDAVDAVAASDGISCELIDLQTLLPWDTATVEASVRKTGRLLISHEAPVTGGFGAEIAARITDKCFLHLEAPVKRVCGYDTPFPLAHEQHYVPSALRCAEAIKDMLDF